MDAPKYQQPPTDPAITALGQKAQADDLSAMQTTAGIDTASLMARYGTRLAMAAGTSQPGIASANLGSPLAVVPPPQRGP